MKDSGEAWLGKIPLQWKVLRGKDIFVERNLRSTQGAEELLSVSARTGVIPRRDLLDSQEALSRADSLADYKICFSGDIVINTMLAWNGSIGLSNFFGIVSPAYAVYKIRRSAFPRFIEYLLRSEATLIKIRTESKGINDARLRLYPDSLFAIVFGLPSPTEQLSIAAWLDLQTARIDKRLDLLNEHRRLLSEYWSAAIQDAVFKGLDQCTPQKASGIEWLPEIPCSWSVMRIKELAVLKSGDHLPSERIDESGKYPVFGGNGLRGYTAHFTHKSEHVLIGRQGALCGNINYAKGPFWATEHAVVARPRRSFILRWFGETLRAMNLNQYATASAQPGLSVEAIANKLIPVPPIDQQRKIALFVEKMAQRVESQISLIDRLETLLKEQRKSIIHEAVTGKIDLSAYEPPPQEAITA